MQRDGDAPTKPPDQLAADLDPSDPRLSRDAAQDGDDDRDTALPPGAYDDFARKASSAELMSPEAKRALSAPSLPKLDAPRDAMATIQDVDLDAPAFEIDTSIPTVAGSRRVQSGPHEIPLDVERDSEPAERTLPLPLPAPVNAVMTPATPTPVGRQPIIAEPGEPEWHDEVTLRDSRAPTVRGKQDVLPPGSGLEYPAPVDESLAFSLDGAPGDAIGLIAARVTPVAPKSDDPLVELRDRYAVGDFTGALSIAEAVLTDDPSNAEVGRYLESCKDILMQMYKARLGALTQIPRIALAAEELRWLTLDHRSGFLLSCIDGISTVEDLLDVSGMPPLDTLRILYTLMQQQIIEMTPSR